jgi:excisionase family DNA binding protein
MADELLTAGAASKVLGYTVQHTRLLIRKNRLPARKLGRDWVIERQALEALKSRSVRQHG